MPKKKASKKANASAWFYPVRNSYLPKNAIGKLLYIPYILLILWPFYLVTVVVRACDQAGDLRAHCAATPQLFIGAGFVLTTVGYYIGLVTAMTYIARKHS